MRNQATVIVIALLAAAGAHAQAPANAASSAVPARAASVTVPAAVRSVPASAASGDGVDMADIRTFTRAFMMVKRAYVDKVSDQRLMRAAIHGMLKGLDPHSAYLRRDALRSLGEDTSGAYGGIGVVVAQMGGRLRVIAPLDGTPAARAGVRAGDIIVSVAGHAVNADNAGRLIDQLRGPAGSVLRLSVLHEQASAPTPLTLTRERIEVRSVRTRLLAPGYVDIRISEFQQRTGDDLRAQLRALSKAHGPLRGAVLDLRSNPGGLVVAAVAVADAFLDRGTIVTTRGRLRAADTTFSASPGDLLDGAPLVVLVDQGTASAAEIVAGALKDHGRALIMGQRTFGKGSVQTVLPLGDGAALKLTTARYFTPNGSSIQARGITPDIHLDDLALNARVTAPTLITSEADLPHHLQAATPADASTGAAAADATLALHDYALSAALNVLKGLALSEHPPGTRDPD